MKNNSSLYLCILLSSLVFLFALPITMASEEKPYMVYMRQKPEGVNCETYQLSALSKVLGRFVAPFLFTIFGELFLSSFLSSFLYCTLFNFYEQISDSFDINLCFMLWLVTSVQIFDKCFYKSEVTIFIQFIDVFFMI